MIEVPISKIHKHEAFRSAHADGVISGLRTDGYMLRGRGAEARAGVSLAAHLSLREQRAHLSRMMRSHYGFRPLQRWRSDYKQDALGTQTCGGA